ncbi:hypothetical protein K9M59_04455 [Candidatus Gracilibacteria bacterium]|nr:hypothetical protein [Candidatus Gracilibacteria bacterium]MCF7819571.1 hypothetical protein [Candidatus Gracilibacteria bacterium]
MIQKSLRFFFYLWAFALATALTLALIFFLVSQGVHLLDDTNIMRTALEKSDPLINILWQKTMNTMFSIPPQ